MIEMTYLDSSFNSKQSVKVMQASHDPTAFAKQMEEASNKVNNRRQITGKTADKPEKGEGRKAWAQERSRSDHRTDQMKDTKSDIKESIDDLDQTDQDEAVKSGHSMLMWLLDMPAELHDLAGISSEEDMVISEDAVKNILLWMQSMTELDNLPEELKVLTEKLTAMFQDQNGLDASRLTTEQKTEIETFLLQVDSMIDSMKETFSTDRTETSSAEQDILMQSAVAAEVISENATSDTGKTKGAITKPDAELMKETNIIEDQIVKNVMTNASDNQTSDNQSKDEKAYASKVIPEEIMTNEQSKEAVIPFSLTQIESLLQQNTMINELNQQQTQIQQNVLQQVVDKIQVILGTTQNFVSLHLAPEHLGKLTIQLTSDLQQGMTAKIYAETPQAKEMIESNFGQLKDALSGKGVNLTALEVYVGQDPESSEKQREFQYQQARAQRRRGSRIAKTTSTERTALVSEIPLTNNPYVLTEGFDRLG